MRVYLAAPYGAREQIRTYAGLLDDWGVRVTSSWLREEHEINAGTTGPAAGLPDSTVAGHASQDLLDIDVSDVVVLFTAASVGVEGGGGRHVETGYAIAREKPVIVVGQPENVFHRLGMPQVQLVETWGQVVDSLQRRAEGACVVCGCDDEHACDGGCWWIRPNLCSACAA